MKAWVSAGCPALLGFDETKPAYKTTDGYAQCFDGSPSGSNAFKAAYAIMDLIPRPVPV